MNRKAVAGVLGLWFVVLMIACGRDLLQPPERAQSDADVLAGGPGGSVQGLADVDPDLLKIEVANAYECSTVEYTESALGGAYVKGGMTLSGPDRPPLIELRPGADPTTVLTRFHYTRWGIRSGRKLFEVDCVVPIRDEVIAFVLAQLRPVGPGRVRTGQVPNPGPGPSQAGQAVADAIMSNTWEDEESIECWYYEASGIMECEGVTCYPTAWGSGAVGPDGPDSPASASSEPTEWECENGCSIWEESAGGYDWLFECPWFEEEECDPGTYSCCWDEVNQEWEWDYYGECGEGSGGGGGGDGEGCDGDIESCDEYDVQLSCEPTTVVRGADIACSASGTAADTSIFTWTFLPGTVRFFDTDALDVYGDTVPGPSAVGDTAWGGKMVYPGCIQVVAIPDPDGSGTGSPVTDQVCIAIENRSGSDWRTPESVVARAPNNQPWGAPPGAGVVVGRNFNYGSTSVDGDVRFVGGLNTATINDDGPNHGYLYILSSEQEIKREYQLNQHVDEGGPVIGLGLNFWAATQQFGGSPEAFAAGITAHETYGDPGTGHQGMLHDGRDGDECGDVRRRVERVSGTPGKMSEKVLEVIDKAKEYLNRAIDQAQPHSWVGNNYSNVLIAAWNANQLKFDSVYVHDAPQGSQTKSAPEYCLMKY